jgi:predicted dehydrogenase
VNRREWLQTAISALPLGAQTGKRHRVAIIGETGAGDYGHEWDTGWNGLDGVEVVALADAGEKGRIAAGAKSHAQRLYPDYRLMLEKEKPEFVAICSRSPEHRLEMVTAAAAAGAHMLIEKPLAKDLVTADAIVGMARQRRLEIAMGFVTSVHPAVVRAKEMVAAGEIGVLQEMRARGKEDRRAGGEDMAVLGPHLFDLMRLFGGDPRWVFASVTEDGRETGSGQVRQPTEPVGPVAGNQIAAMFSFDHGIQGYFGSKVSDVPNGSRFGLTLYGSKGAIFVPVTKYPDGEPLLLRSPSWRPDAKSGDWKRIDAPDGERIATREAANTLTAADLIQAVEQKRRPARSAVDGCWTVEMLQGVYLSQKTQARADFPLKDRRHPLMEA